MVVFYQYDNWGTEMLSVSPQVNKWFSQDLNLSSTSLKAKLLTTALHWLYKIYMFIGFKLY